MLTMTMTHWTSHNLHRISACCCRQLAFALLYDICHWSQCLPAVLFRHHVLAYYLVVAVLYGICHWSQWLSLVVLGKHIIVYLSFCRSQTCQFWLAPSLPSHRYCLLTAPYLSWGGTSWSVPAPPLWRTFFLGHCPRWWGSLVYFTWMTLK